MKLLKQRIIETGEIIQPNILKVDNFLNHQIDTLLFKQIGEEFKTRFNDVKVDKIVTIEASGIGISVMVSDAFNNIPVVFAKKGSSSIMDESSYCSKVHSFTKNMDYNACIKKKFLKESENILIIDDFLANGQAVLGLIDLIKQANANVVGVGIVIEKGFQDGRSLIEEKGVKLESLAIIEEFRDGKVILK